LFVCCGIFSRRRCLCLMLCTNEHDNTVVAISLSSTRSKKRANLMETQIDKCETEEGGGGHRQGINGQQQHIALSNDCILIFHRPDHLKKVRGCRGAIRAPETRLCPPYAGVTAKFGGSRVAKDFIPCLKPLCLFYENWTYQITGHSLRKMKAIMFERTRDYRRH